MTTVSDNERVVLAALASEHGLLDFAVADEAITSGLPDGLPLLKFLLARIPAEKLLHAIADELGVAYVDFHAADLPYQVVEAVLARCDVAVLKSLACIPLVEVGSSQVVVAAANPAHPEVRDYMSQRYPEGFRTALAPKKDIDAKLVFYEALEREQEVGEQETEIDDPNALSLSGPQSPAVEWVDTTLQRAAAEGASDIHFNFDLQGRLKLRMRVDGMLREMPVPLRSREQGEVVPSLLARCVTIDSSNLRLPADGTFTFSAAGRRIDVRAGMLPQINGPTMVLRLLDPANVQRPLESFGFSGPHMETLRHAVAQSQGMVMVCGPTGSGKSTTLYGLLNEIDAQARNVLTVEDPVEYKLPYINQTQIKDGLGERSLTFAKALRSILRLDPDVILVGECRDDVTARIAMDASITGHMVLSTVHANNAIQTFTRLIEMGVPAYLVAEAISCAVSQRLLRKVHQCAAWREPTATEADLLSRFEVEADRVPVTVGCAGCAGTGYRGRIAVLEVLAPSRKLRALVASRAPADELTETALAGGWKPIMHDGLRHVAAGATTIDEVHRVLVESEETV